MDTTTASSHRYRPESRHRRRTQDEQRSRGSKEGETSASGGSDHSSLRLQEENKRRLAMTKDHRFYHRRQAQAATRVVMVNVEVVATVDSSGNLVGQETKTPDNPITPTPGAAVDSVASAAGRAVDPLLNAVESVAAPVVSPVLNAVDPALQSGILAPSPAASLAAPSLPQVPSVPSFPTDALPVVPSVPPFPSGLAVPVYPYGSAGVPLQASTGPVTLSSTSAAASTPTSITPSSATPPFIIIPASAASNSTTTGTLPLVSNISLTPSNNTSSSIDASVTAAVVASFGSSSSDSANSSSDGAAPSRLRSTAASPPAANPTFIGGAGAGAPGNPAPPAAKTSSAAGAASTGSTIPLAPPQVVGSVVGSLAGAALILAVILLLLRRHKRKRKGALQLGNEETTERAAPPMSQSGLMNNRIPSYLHRFSAISGRTVDTSASGGERSFQRVSGRKLPSAFSEGMTSEQFAHGGAPTMSGSSFYIDENGTYSGPGSPKEMGKDIGGSPVIGAGKMNIRPSPARTPVIRHPDDDSNPFDDPAPFPRHTTHLSPPQSPNPEKPRSTLGRSLQSADGSRSSKFTENV